MGWAYLVHETTGGTCVVPDDLSVITAQEARGWKRHVLPPELDPDAPNYAGDVPGAPPEVILSEEEALDLKGKALDQALRDAGLSTTGSADDKRARLAEHEAALATPTTEQEEVSNG